ncbi:MAG: 3-oxoacyl-ACP reductase FabG [Syntrophales bacterium]|nr:3-oxoacyl-ACP reductase FabG [Syntrophales bacterium]MDY0044981.1 3-oxoacyl-ACP reductase family protein [Syntrophales bacterium]
MNFIITGAAQGIGRSISLKLARQGANVVVADLNESEALKVAYEIDCMGKAALPLKVDITDTESVRHMVAETIEKFQFIDGLVNNAGGDQIGFFLDTDEEIWDQLISLNLMGPIRCCHEVLKVMVPRQRGKIVNIGSDAARHGSIGEAVYSAAKGGVIAFTKSLAREVARYQINVNCVSPGPTKTAQLEQSQAILPGLADALKKSIPLKRLGEPDNIADAVVFLLSDEADYITGQTVSVSGGLTML